MRKTDFEGIFDKLEQFFKISMIVEKVFTHDSQKLKENK